MLAIPAGVSANGDTTSAPAASGKPTIDRVEVGIRGRFKVGCWTPAVIHVTTDRAMKVRPCIETSDPDGSITLLPGDVVELPAAGQHRIDALFKSGRIDSRLKVILRDAGSAQTSSTADTNNLSEEPLLAEREFRAAPADRTEMQEGEIPRGLTQKPILVAALGKPAGFVSTDSPEGTADENQTGSTPTETGADLLVVEVGAPNELPAQSEGLDSIDLVAIAGRFDIDDAHSLALQDWVREGGHLLLSVGANADKYMGTPLSKWVPVTVSGTTDVRDLSRLEDFVGKGTRIELRGATSTPAAEILSPAGIISANSPDGPLLVQVPYGFGRVTFLALDLSTEPLATWPGAATLVDRIVHADNTASAETKLHGGPSMLTHTGITDIATQIHAAQDHFPQVTRYSMWMVMGLLVLYLVIIGPIDYFLVHKLLKRPGLTWLTFPLIVAGAAALAVWSAGRSNGDAMRLNQLDLVDIDVDSHSVRARSWIMLYSPESARYRVDAGPLRLDTAASDSSKSKSARKATPDKSANNGDAQPSAEASSLLTNDMKVTWNGVPENSYSGMYRTGGFELARSGYTFGENASDILNLPIPIWSTKGLTATWQDKANELVECNLTGSTGGLDGTIVHHFGQPLEDWVVAYGKMAYTPADNTTNPRAMQLGKNETLRFSASNARLRRRDLHGFLTGLRRTTVTDQRNQKEKVDIRSESYQPLSRDTDRIFRILTFFTRAGGKTYTTLENNDYRSLDLSPLLDLNRAVLFGKLSSRAADVRVDGESMTPAVQATYVRVVLPVKTADPRTNTAVSNHP